MKGSTVFSVWADAISFTLGGVLLVVGGLAPRRPLWATDTRNRICCLLIVVIYVWNIFRYVYEAVKEKPGPREFMLLTITYASKWIALYVKLAIRDTEAKRLYETGRCLRHVKMLQVGVSTSVDRKGEMEVVIRRGVLQAKGKYYWRGTEESVKKFEGPDGIRIWKVLLQQSRLYGTKLNAWGTVSYLNGGADLEDVYKTVYKLILKTDRKNLENYKEFLEKWGYLPPDTLAESVGAIAMADIGHAARRVAADALYYISKKQNARLRARNQIAMINACIDQAANDEIKKHIGDEHNNLAV